MRKKFVKNFLIIVGLALPFTACKGRSKSIDMSTFISQNCAQHPINFHFHELARGTQVYRYGSRDQEFRGFLAKIEQRYRTDGRDISAREKIQLVGDFLPNYMDTCQRFFEPSIAECSHFDAGSGSFHQCLSRYNHAYEEALNLVMKKSGRDLVNLEQISLIHQPRIAESDRLH